jgi:acyl carrier protein
LDLVEVVMRCEDSFDVHLETAQLESMRTVGDLFQLVCEQLSLPVGLDVPVPREGATEPLVAVPAGGWTRDAVWIRLVHLCADQLQVEPDEVTYEASFVDDLGAD